MLIENIIAFTDTAFLGRVGEADLAAASIAGMYYVCVFIVGFGFSIGAQVLMAHANGAGEYSKVGEIFSTSLSVLVAMAVIGFAGTVLLGEDIFSLMTPDKTVVAQALKYTHWRQFGFFAIFLIIAYRSMYVGLAQTKVLAYSSWIMGLVNCGLDYLLIFGKFGLPALGVEGAAIASVSSEFLGLGVFVLFTAKKFDRAKYGLKTLRFSSGLLLKLVRLSSWTMAQQLVYVGMWLLLFSFIGHFGRHELAQSNIFKSVLMFLYMPMYAFGSAVNSVTGNLIGERREGEIIPMCGRIAVMEYAVVLPALALCVAFPFEIMGVYTDNPAILDGASCPFYAALFTVPFSIPSIILSNMILGFERTRAALVIEAISIIPYVAGLYLCAFAMKNFSAIWTMDAWYWMIVIIMNIYYIRHRILPKNAVSGGAAR